MSQCPHNVLRKKRPADPHEYWHDVYVCGSCATIFDVTPRPTELPAPKAKSEPLNDKVPWGVSRPTGIGDKMQLYLDVDGVMADFDGPAERIFGLPSRKAEETLGTPRFWADLRSAPNFYRDLPLMPDALVLLNKVKHLRPIFLTGVPAGGWAEPQKIAWRDYHFPGVKMICCRSKEKRQHMKPGDTLVDDRLKYSHLWLEAGGIFVHHTSAEDSIKQLRRLGVLRK